MSESSGAPSRPRAERTRRKDLLFVIFRSCYMSATCSLYTAGVILVNSRVLRTNRLLSYFGGMALGVNCLATLLSLPTSTVIFAACNCIFAHIELVDMCTDNLTRLGKANSKEWAKSREIGRLLSNLESVCAVGEEANAFVSPFLLTNHATLLVFGAYVLYGSFSIVFYVINHHKQLFSLSPSSLSSWLPSSSSSPLLSPSLPLLLSS